MDNNSLILIGTKINEIQHKTGEYQLCFLQAVLTFDEGSYAIAAYDQIEGEAYLWDISNQQQALLIQAKLIKNFIQA